ncbi:glycosyltransferase family 4 protein, partial [bacterium]|nr:glycosyltransferase family 4 protein [bacterium]
MKIILVPNFYLPQLGGVEIAISNIARQFKLQGHEVTIVTNSSSLKLSKEIEPSGIAVYRMPFLPCRIITGLGYKRAMYSLLRTAFSPLSMLISFFKLLRVITLAKPDVVNLHYIGENRLLCLAAKKCIPFKLVVNIHGEDIERHFERSILGRWLAWRTLRSADRVLSNSNHLLNKAIQICPEVGTKSAVVGNGVNLEELVTATKFEYPMKYILSIGRFFQKKGHDILIRAFQLLRQENP